MIRGRVGSTACLNLALTPELERISIKWDHFRSDFIEIRSRGLAIPKALRTAALGALA